MKKQLARWLLAFALLAGLVAPALYNRQSAPARANAAPSVRIYALWGRIQGFPVAILQHDVSQLPEGWTDKMSVPPTATFHWGIRDIFAGFDTEIMRKGPTWWWLKANLTQFSARKDSFPYPSGSCVILDVDVDCESVWIRDIEIGWLDLTHIYSSERWRRTEYHPFNHVQGHYPQGLVDPDPPRGTTVIYGQTERIGTALVTSAVRTIAPTENTDLRHSVVIVDCRSCPPTP